MRVARLRRMVRRGQYSHRAERVRHLQNVLLFLQILLKSVPESTAAF